MQNSNIVSVASFIFASDLRNEFYTLPRREESCAERASVLCPSLHSKRPPMEPILFHTESPAFRAVVRRANLESNAERVRARDTRL